MFTINQLVKRFGLSRSTLLYYDKIGLLEPSARSVSNYRLYSQKDLERMEKVITYRNAGLPLDSIMDILEAGDTAPTLILERQLENINEQVDQLRYQQELIVQLLGSKSALRSSRLMSKEAWVEILKASGLDEDGMHQWHIEFEREFPDLHSDFLKSLGIDSEEISRIKQWSLAR
jgi:DNA-binding transcriptional MerR regulator